MKKIMSAILSLSMVFAAIAAPITANANTRVIPGPIDGWDSATVTRTSWAVPSASSQAVTFYVKAKTDTASYTMLDVTLTNAKILDKNSKVVCNMIGTGGKCPTITTAGINNKFTVIAGTDNLAAGYFVNSAKYR